MSGKILSFSRTANQAGTGPDMHETAVDLGGIMSVLGKHLYSTPVVAVRELVQNAHDSIIRRRLEDTGFAASGGNGRIDVRGDPARGVIHITDTGAGLTDHEVHAYLATVGVGYTRALRGRNQNAGLIGMFGLGFLSAFVLAEEITVTTTSCLDPLRGWRYVSSTGETYSLREVPAREVGTEVRLRLREEFAHLAEPETLRALLGKYCVLLREPVFLNGGNEPVNPEEPPWRLPEATLPETPGWLHRKQMEFARRFDPHFNPLCVIPVRPQGPDNGGVAGLLWVQDGATYGTTDNRQLAVFARGMLLDDDARDLLPGWAGFVSGVVESDLLTPTASREDLQKDEAYHAARRAVAEALISGLAEVPSRFPEAWRRVLARHNDALLGASICDRRLFDLLADSVHIRTSRGEMPARGLRAASGAVHVCLGAQGGFEDMLFRMLGTPVARGELYGVVPFLRMWAESRGAVLVELGTERGNRRLFTRLPLPGDQLEWLRAAIGHGEELIPARFAPEELPLVVVRDHDAELKLRLEQDEADKRISAAALRLARRYTATLDASAPVRLYVNMGNPAVQALMKRCAAGREPGPPATLLRSLKVIMAAGGADPSADLNQALAEFCAVAQTL